MPGSVSKMTWARVPYLVEEIDIFLMIGQTQNGKASKILARDARSRIITIKATSVNSIRLPVESSLRVSAQPGWAD